MADLTAKFLEIIESFPCLYNNTLQEYSRKDITDKSWMQVSQQMQWPVNACKKEWRNIRNNFVRSLKGHPTGSGARPKKPYYLHDSLQFVLEFIRPLKHSSVNDSNNLFNYSDPLTESEEVFSEESFCDAFVETPKQRLERRFSARKRKRSANENEDIAETAMKIVKSNGDRREWDEGRRLFLLSLLYDVDKLSEENYTQFRTNTLVELQKLLKQQTQSGNPHFHREEWYQVCST